MSRVCQAVCGGGPGWLWMRLALLTLDCSSWALGFQTRNIPWLSCLLQVVVVLLKLLIAGCCHSDINNTLAPKYVAYGGRKKHQNLCQTIYSEAAKSIIVKNWGKSFFSPNFLTLGIFVRLKRHFCFLQICWRKGMQCLGKPAYFFITNAPKLHQGLN